MIGKTGIFGGFIARLLHVKNVGRELLTGVRLQSALGGMRFSKPSNPQGSTALLNASRTAPISGLTYVALKQASRRRRFLKTTNSVLATVMLVL